MAMAVATVIDTRKFELERIRRASAITDDITIIKWDTVEPFNRLTNEQKLFAHFLSKAAWYGSLIIPLQTSPESPVLFALLHDLFKTNTLTRVKEIAIEHCLYWEDDWKEFLAYSCAVFTNGGNYWGFDNTKFIPALSATKMNALIMHPKIRYNGHEYNFREKWNAIKERVYSFDEVQKQLGCFSNKGITTYYTPNFTEGDTALVNRFMQDYKIESVNTRVFKVSPNPNPTFIEPVSNKNKNIKNGTSVLYEVRTASADGDFGFGCSPRFDFQGAEFILTSGDYSPILKDVRYWLHEARQFATNDHEKNMLDSYINSFFTGSIDDHKEGSRHWLQNTGPQIETYLGFVQTYRDPSPSGTRAEYEGFVFIKDDLLSEKFDKLAKNASTFLTRLPWPSDFEKDVFIEPDFKALDVLTYAGTCLLDLLNLPNYDDVRQTHGFKNMSLRKIYQSLYADSVPIFISKLDVELFDEYYMRAHDVQVGLHEILGHGSGKLLVRNLDGSTNFSSDLINPVTNTYIASVYETGETFNSLFRYIGDSMEECRAECVGLYLSLEQDILEVFGLQGEDGENVTYINWLESVHAGMMCLKSYDPICKIWKQSHDQAKFAILRVLAEAGEGLVTIKETLGKDGKQDLCILLDKSKISTIGKKTIGDLLLKLQVFKSTADVQSAQRLFLRITTVTNEGLFPWLKWRGIVLRKRKQKKLYVQPNTFITAGGTSARIVSYEATFEGLIQSWLDRYDDNGDGENPSLYDQLDYCWKKDKHHFF